MKGGWNLKSKKLFYAGLLSLLVLISVLVFHQSILKGAGMFLAPASLERAEVLILEGTQVVENGAVAAAMRLLSEGKANRIVFILHQYSKERKVFAVQDSYPHRIIDELIHLGLRREEIEVITAPIDGHPITLSEARFVVSKLSQDGIRSAILFSSGFHTRRSFAVYSLEGKRVGLHVVPYPYFTGFDVNSWWHDPRGVAEFGEECLKLAYYLLHGYVSIGSLWTFCTIGRS
jgi:hypothetical protein